MKNNNKEKISNDLRFLTKEKNKGIISFKVPIFLRKTVFDNKSFSNNYINMERQYCYLYTTKFLMILCNGLTKSVNQFSNDYIDYLNDCDFEELITTTKKIQFSIDDLCMLSGKKYSNDKEKNEINNNSRKIIKRMIDNSIDDIMNIEYCDNYGEIKNKLIFKKVEKNYINSYIEVYFTNYFIKEIINSTLYLHITKNIFKFKNNNDILGSIYIANNKYINTSYILRNINSSTTVKTFLEKNGKTINDYKDMRKDNFKRNVQNMFKKEIDVYGKNTFKFINDNQTTVEGFFYNAKIVFNIKAFNYRIAYNKKIKSIQKGSN